MPSLNFGIRFYSDRSSMQVVTIFSLTCNFNSQLHFRSIAVLLYFWIAQVQELDLDICFKSCSPLKALTVGICGVQTSSDAWLICINIAYILISVLSAWEFWSLFFSEILLQLQPAWFLSMRLLSSHSKPLARFKLLSRNDFSFTSHKPYTMVQNVCVPLKFE